MMHLKYFIICPSLCHVSRMQAIVQNIHLLAGEENKRNKPCTPQPATKFRHLFEERSFPFIAYITNACTNLQWSKEAMKESQGNCANHLRCAPYPKAGERDGIQRNLQLQSPGITKHKSSNKYEAVRIISNRTEHH